MRVVSFFSVLSLGTGSLRAEQPSAEQAEFFEKKVRPILIEHCYSCHSAGAEKIKGGLRVDSREAILAGGEGGKVVVLGQPEKSKLIEALTYKNVDLQMPKKGKLADAVIADLAAWVKMGLPWPGKADTTVAVKDAFDLAKRRASHWSWKPIADVSLPPVKDTKWPISSADRFILAKLETKGITPAKSAEPHVLLRRIHFDLTGLPPTVAEIAEFEREYAAQPRAALEKSVDKLLVSPQFGERWARHWLDLVRYGESRGHEFEPTIPNAWQYRDYVIRAFNADVPYNRFVTEHLAGDLMPQPRLNPKEGFNEAILGTGFWFLGEEVHSPVDIRGDEADRFDNRIDVLTKTFLGLTVSCARCHDHKFDAITTKDYYALYGFLRSSSYRLARFDSLEHNRQIGQKLAELRAAKRGAILDALAKTLRPGVEQLPDILKQARASMISGKASDNELVRFWVTYLEKAARDENDLFHTWATLPAKDDGLSEKLKAFVDRARQREFEAAFDKPEIIVDYANLRPGEWISDDAAFGSGPVHAGEPRFGTDRLRPISRFHDTTAADADPVWRGMKVAPGTQNDYGALGAIFRAGRTLHTPNFAINSNKVWILAKGYARAYAAVDAHTIIGGPLHGSLVINFNTNGKWQWVSHDLKNYRGHRAHLEFTPNDDNDFSVAMVVQVEKPPAMVNVPNKLLRNRFEIDGPTIDKTADAYRKTFAIVLDLFERDTLHTSSPDAARLANWMLDNAGLLGVQTWDKVAEASTLFLEEQAKLVGQIRRDSRLALAMIDGTGVNEQVFIRGSHKEPGEIAPRRLLESLVGEKGIETPGSGRLEMAQQMTDPKVNPFVTRVIVNRVWHHLFGRGIVATTDNFGVMGELPTHPELLDHLATRFANEGWSIKKLIRELVLSRTYQMSSHPDEKADAADPENLLLHRMRLRRLQGEAIRDSMLAVSGRLNPTMFGPSIPIQLTPFLDGRGRPASGPLDGDGRRSLYSAVRRNFLSPMMLAFDTPSPFSTVGRRTVSNVPAQALILMNDPFVHLMADLWGKKMATASGSPKERIADMYRQAFSRPPTEKELSDCLGFLEANAVNDPKAWASLAHVLFNVKEFIYVE